MIYYGENYGTMKKNTTVLQRKLWYYTENYCTTIYINEVKNTVDYQKVWNIDI